MGRPIGRDTYGRDGLVVDFVAPPALRQLVAHHPAGLPGTVSGDAIVVGDFTFPGAALCGSGSSGDGQERAGSSSKASQCAGRTARKWR
jgi:hypothetical protein